MKTISGIVRRGYITRFLKEEEWEDELVEVPLGCYLIDGDAIPYYLLNKEDGKYYEYYGHYAPEGEHAYVSVEIYYPEMFES